MIPYILPQDDPVVRCMERTGLPPWLLNQPYEDDEEWDDWEDYDDGDVFYGNSTAEF